MGKIMKIGNVVLVLNGRYAGRKAIVVKIKPESPKLPSVHDQPPRSHSLESEPCRLPPRLNHVEIRHHNKDVTFYCKLCNDPCSSQSIMEHLKGYKHRLHCLVYDSYMNNRSMWESHVRGKRHLKNKNKVPVGLQHCREFQRIDEEPIYQCFLCSANLPNSKQMIDHVTGTKHRLACLKEKKMKQYELISKFCLRKCDIEVMLEEFVERSLKENRQGKMQVRVERLRQPERTYEVTNDEPAFLSEIKNVKDRIIADPGYKHVVIAGKRSQIQKVADDYNKGLLPGLNHVEIRHHNKDVTFYCKLCNDPCSSQSIMEHLKGYKHRLHCLVYDSYMNNRSMWESHVRGKRHLKNKNKVPVESASKTKAIPIPGAILNLIKHLEEQSDPIVGLDYIRETQGESGDMYNCFLCGACTSEYDIIDHLLTIRHQTKYLEAALKKEQLNGIESIKLLSPIYKEDLIKHECQSMVEQFGSGTIEVYRSKTLSNSKTQFSNENLIKQDANKRIKNSMRDDPFRKSNHRRDHYDEDLHYEDSQFNRSSLPVRSRNRSHTPTFRSRRRRSCSSSRRSHTPSRRSPIYRRSPTLSRRRSRTPTRRRSYTRIRRRSLTPLHGTHLFLQSINPLAQSYSKER